MKQETLLIVIHFLIRKVRMLDILCQTSSLVLKYHFILMVYYFLSSKPTQQTASTYHPQHSSPQSKQLIKRLNKQLHNN